MVANLDGQLHNADWIKMERDEWELPEYKSEEFYDFLERNDMTLEEFKELPVYEVAIEKGIISE